MSLLDALLKTHAQLAEIDENLCRSNLTPTQEAEHLQRRKEIWEAMNNATSCRENPGRPEGFAAATEAATGVNKRTTQRATRRAVEVCQEARDMIRGTKLETGTQHSTPANSAKAANPPPPISRISNISKGREASGTFCERWCEAALAAGVLPEVIERLPDAEMELYRQHFDTCADPYRAMQAAAGMLADSATMAEGRVPLGWTAAAVCQHCGPVLLHPDAVKLLDVKDGHPWCWGCPWCHVTMPPGHRLPRPTA